MESSPKRFEGQVAIVTGSAQGLGAEYALRLAAAGAKVVIADVKDGSSIVEQIESAGGEAMALHVDVSGGDSVRRMVSRVVEVWGRIDILVNNAAIVADLDMCPVLEMDSAQWQRVMAVNAGGTFECHEGGRRGDGQGGPRQDRQHCVVDLLQGRCVDGALRRLERRRLGLTRSVARELGDYGITVNCVAPGLTITPQLRNLEGYSGARLQTAIGSRALRREQAPDDLVGAVLFFCSTDSDFTTGQTLVVDGGGVMQ